VREAWTSDLLADGEGNAFVLWNDGRQSAVVGDSSNIYFTSTLDVSPVQEHRTGLTSCNPSLANAPNPFRLSTTIRFELPEAGEVLLTVQDVNGRRVALLASGHREAGEFQRAWHGRDATGKKLGPGIYLVQLKAGDRTITRKMILLR